MLKIGKAFWAAINRNDEIAKSPENDIVGDSRDEVLQKMKAWNIDKEEYWPEKVVIVRENDLELLNDSGYLGDGLSD